MNIFFPEYLVLFLILAAAGYKALKAFLADTRKEEPPVKEIAGKAVRK